MAGKVIIYGGSGGIGAATARLLCQQGQRVHLVGRNEEKLAALAQELDGSYTAGDVLDNTLFSSVAADAAAPWDGLVYAVGTIHLGSLRRFSEDDFLHDFRVNSVGAALAVQAALPALKKSMGIASVVLFSSVAASQGFTFHASIGMAKGAINGLTLSLAAELAPKIRVNAVAPSLTCTPLSERILSSEKMVESLAGLHPMRRLGTPEDIAHMVSFLLSSQADWLTGQIVGVDGGRSTLRTTT